MNTSGCARRAAALRRGVSRRTLLAACAALPLGCADRIAARNERAPPDTTKAPSDALPGPAQAPHRTETPWLDLPPTPTLPDGGIAGLVPAGDVQLYVAQYGSGRPVVLLHGGLANANWWGHQVPALAASYRVIAVETRGHGRSTTGTKPHGYAQYAADVVQVLDRLGIERAAVVGWSDGGITALAMSMTVPRRLSGMFLYGANFSTAGARPGGGNAALMHDYVARCGQEYRVQSPRPAGWGALNGELSRMWRSSPQYGVVELGRIRTDAVVSDGAHDEIILPAHTQALAAAIPGARLVWQAEMSHFGMLQDPPAFNAAVIDFLRKLRA